jgi:Mg2+ and Co2+ transporter CorA
MSSSHTPLPATPEEGDYIINWHLQYCATILLQSESNIRNIADQIKAELSKIKTDFEFIKQHYDGPHHNLLRLKATDKDLLKSLDALKETSDMLRKLSTKAAQRII